MPTAVRIGRLDEASLVEEDAAEDGANILVIEGWFAGRDRLVLRFLPHPARAPPAA